MSTVLGPYVEPPAGVSYPQILRGPTFEWWRSVFGIALGLSLYLMLAGLLFQAISGLGWLFSGRPGDFTSFSGRAYRFELPVGMLAANLSIASLIPVSWLLVTFAHRVKPRWLSSVGPRLRWRYLLICLGIALVSLNGIFVLSAALGPGVKIAAQPGFAGFLVVILLTSPLQAAAEEYFFRGYLMQAFGSLVANPWFGVVVSSLVFAFFHGGQNPALFVDRLGFGLLAGALVLKTGGLEAGIAAHVINNIFAYVIAGLTSSIAAVRGIESIGWADAAFDVGGFALFAVLAWLVSRWLKIQTVTPATAGS